MDNQTQTFNFGAGPACVPSAVIDKIKSDLPDWYQGMSVMEISHRHPVMVDLFEKITQNLRTLLAVPDDFAILFMQGGARAQFAAIPLNLLNQQTPANYLITGMWSELAKREAERYGAIKVVATNAHSPDSIPPVHTWDVDQKAAYFHYTDNETIHGIEFLTPPDVTNQRLISDMTSNLLTKPIDFSRYDLVYASAQKNLGIAGITVVIVRKSLLNGPANPLTPSALNYTLFEQSQSLCNTPSVFAWYVLGLVLDWMQSQGDLHYFNEQCAIKSKLLYDYIDNSNFYFNKVSPDCRSRVNIPFSIPDPNVETLFHQQADKLGFKQLKGHKAVGGLRASVYNAMPQKGVEALIQFMQTFQKEHG